MEAVCPRCATLLDSAEEPCTKCSRPSREAHSSRSHPRTHTGRPANPYTPPASDLLAPEADGCEGVWRDGKLVVMLRDAVLPLRCVTCSAPASTRLPRSLSWHPPLVYLLVFVNLLVYLVVALATRHTARVEVPLCARHLARRRRRIGCAFATIALGAALPALAAAVLPGESAHSATLARAAPLLFAATFPIALMIGMTAAPVTTGRIDRETVRLGGCGEDFRAALPQLPRRARPR